MNKTKIDWADATWNPVTGCFHECPYCYARDVARRFGGWDTWEQAEFTWNRLVVLDNQMKRKQKNGRVTAAPFPFYFDPTFHRYRLDEPVRMKRPRNIFVCSMADLFGEWVLDDWIETVFDACRAAPQNNYIFLTKNWMRACKFRYEPNWWVGRTYTHTEDALALGASDDKNLHLCYGIPRSNEPHMGHKNTFLSIEPIEGPVTDLGYYAHEYGYKWVIIGAETGNRKGKVKPKREWIEEIVRACELRKIPLFMKENLVKEGVLTQEEIIQRWPDGLTFA